MSPEQAAAKPLTPASDVFSLGSTIAFAARGSSLFGGGSGPEILRRVVRDEPDLAAVPDGLRLMVAACLAKNPAERPAPRDVVDFVARGAAPSAAGAWLPPALIAAIERAAEVLAPGRAAAKSEGAGEGAHGARGEGANAEGATPPPAFPDAPPVSVDAQAPPHSVSLPPGTFPPPSPISPWGPPSEPSTQARPGRRKLLIGLAGGAVALAGGGTGLALALRDDAPKRKGTTSASSPSLKDPRRPLDTHTTAAELWAAPLSETLIQVAGEGDTVVAVGADHIRAFDRATGRPLWGPLASKADQQYVGGGDHVAVCGGTVFTLDPVTSKGQVLSTRVLRALDLRTGTVAWSVGGPDSTFLLTSVPGILDGVVYVSGMMATTGTLNLSPGGPFIWAVDSATRSIRWQMLLKNHQSETGTLMIPSFGSRLLWATSNSDHSSPKIAALDARDSGKVLWELPAPGGGQSILTANPGGLANWHDGPHCSAGGHFLYMTDRVHAVDPSRGNTVWRSPADAKAPVQAMVASPDGSTVYTAGPDYLGRIHVYAYDSAQGALRWAGQLSVPQSTTTLGLIAMRCADGHLYLWAKGRVWALDADDGTGRWRYEFDGDGASYTGPVPFWAGGGQVYGTTSKGLVALAATGTKRAGVAA